MAPPQEFTVRRYRPGDRDRAILLAPRLIEGTAPWRDPERTLRAVEVAVRSAIDSFRVPGHAVFVADADGDVVGIVTVSERISFAGQREGENWAIDRGLSCLTLETGAANHAARGLYRALGYEEEDIRLTKHSLPRRAR